MEADMATDSPLVDEMESLELNELENKDKPGPSSSRKRSLRKRVPSTDYSEKRRVLTKPQKRLNISTIDVKHIYLGQKFNKQSQNLETIFEEPKVDKSNEVLYTGPKRKRFLVFDQPNKGKIKKRQVRMKKHYGRTTLKRKRGTMDALLAKLNTIE